MRAKTKAQRHGAWALLIGVVIMFVLVISAWTILINIARGNPVQQIDFSEQVHPSVNRYEP